MPGLLFGTVFLFFLLFILADPVCAVQSHGGPEGLVAHQLGHLLFIAGMLFLLLRRHVDRWAGPGWNSFKGFLGLTIGWNILTFFGHFLEVAIEEEKFVRAGGRITGFHASNVSDLFYYLSQLDHILLLPALFILMRSLRQWSRAAEPPA